MGLREGKGQGALPALDVAVWLGAAPSLLQGAGHLVSAPLRRCIPCTDASSAPMHSLHQCIPCANASPALMHCLHLSVPSGGPGVNALQTFHFQPLAFFFFSCISSFAFLGFYFSSFLGLICFFTTRLCGWLSTEDIRGFAVEFAGPVTLSAVESASAALLSSPPSAAPCPG